MTETVTGFFARLLRPLLWRVSRWLLAPERVYKTWQFEAAFVALVLAAVAVLTTPHPWIGGTEGEWRQFFIIWLSAGAVLGSFLHAKVGYRMQEAMIADDASTTSCYQWLGTYWVWKEALWLLVFVVSGAYPAIAGTIIFLLYPAWRIIHLEERRRMRGTIKHD